MADAQELTGSRASTWLPSRAVVAHIVFYLGLVVTLAGFLGDKAEDMPLVLQRVAPTYARASRGLDTLQARGELTRADEGFAALAALVHGELVSSGKLEGTLEIVRFVDRFPRIANRSETGVHDRPGGVRGPVCTVWCSAVVDAACHAGSRGSDWRRAKQ